MSLSAAALAEPKEPSAKVLQFITFDIEFNQRVLTMALNVQKIKEVVPMAPLSQLPGDINCTLGLYDLGGCPVPVLDIPKIISPNKVATQLPDSTHRLVICEIQSVWIAIPVLKTGRLMNCKTGDFLPPPPGSTLQNTRLVTGLIRKDQSYIPMLDIDSLTEAAGYTAAVESSIPTPAGLYNGKTVLLVDDSRTILKRLDQIFTQLGFKCTLAANGEEALQKLAEAQYKFDLLFTDIEMPLLDGIAMVRKLTQVQPSHGIPILFNSALSNPALISDIEKEKLGEYLIKFDQPLILSHLNQLFART